MPLSIFGFRALWSPYFLTLIILFSVGYFLLVLKYSHLFKESKPLTAKQGILFILGITLLYLIKGGPIDLMGHLMFYAHMIQMAFLLFIIPPIFITAIPDWVWRSIWSKAILKGFLTFFTRPIIAIIVFNAFFSIYHLPVVFDIIKTNVFLHEIYTTLLFIFALCMWWPLINKLDNNQSIVGIKKVAYIFANSALILPACVLIIFNDKPMYATYYDPEMWTQALALCVPASTLSMLDLNGPEMFSNMSLIHDQQLGGVIMKIIQEIIFGTVLARVFIEWYRKDQEESQNLLNEYSNLSEIENESPHLT